MAYLRPRDDTRHARENFEGSQRVAVGKATRAKLPNQIQVSLYFSLSLCAFLPLSMVNIIRSLSYMPLAPMVSEPPERAIPNFTGQDTD